MEIPKRIIDFVTASNWFLFVVVTLFSFINTPFRFACGFMLGAFIVTVNFHFLKTTLKKTFNPSRVIYDGRMILTGVLVKYYIRFIVSGLVIFLLISKDIVNPLGLLAGLSVVVASMFSATIIELTKLIFREAV
ncbi:MAG: ATP synthase subunit I [Desulfobacteraceae bacterium]